MKESWTKMLLCVKSFKWLHGAGNICDATGESLAFAGSDGNCQKLKYDGLSREIQYLNSPQQLPFCKALTGQML